MHIYIYIFGLIVNSHDHSNNREQINKGKIICLPVCVSHEMNKNYIIER